MIRPTFHDFPGDAQCWEENDDMLLGPDLLVAPVHAAGATRWSAYLPQGDAWIHLWSGAAFDGGQRVEVDAPLGQPPVFVRRGCTQQDFFLSLAK